tara:strand:- start:4109 stop:4741 length:633 start_codon:yes stop_codon:yes gene_type:complete
LLKNYSLLIKYTAIIPNTPPSKVDECNVSDRKYIAKPIAVNGTKNIKELALLGPNFNEARKYIEVPNDIAKTDSIMRFNQKTLSKSKIMKRSSLMEIGILIKQAKVKLQKLYAMNEIVFFDLDVKIVTQTHDNDARIKKRFPDCTKELPSISHNRIIKAPPTRPSTSPNQSFCFIMPPNNRPTNKVVKIGLSVVTRTPPAPARPICVPLK